MTVTKDDLQAFNRFADEKLTNGGGDSLVDIVRQWEAERESQETIADILESHADIEAGRVKPLDEAFADVRKKMGLTAPRSV